MDNVDINNSHVSQQTSSSSEDSGSSKTSSTSPSSVLSQLKESWTEESIEVQLPSPFFPASLIDPTLGIRPKELPTNLDLPIVPVDEACKVVDPQDEGSPDAWVRRDPRLVRLTGKHPFNAEARIKDLYAQGFFTPSNLFFVRNHGAVPQVDVEMAESWRLEIHGLCANPVTFSLHDLRTKFQVVTLPVTLVCAGNRRKEQNVVQKSLGFSWGAGGVSTALFTGVYLCDVLEHVRPARKAKHIIFEGCDQLPNGPYGTSQLVSWAGEKRKGMMLAWAMNGLALEPDHGFPLRLVVPSQIGGRSVKWLTRIELSENESQHHLHFHDNKVLPMPLGPDRARAEKEWWYDPRYIIRDLNVNSAIACPDHDEVLETANVSPEAVYTLKGYAYAGGGRRITRVEVSFDDGSTWCLAEISYPEDLFREVIHADPIYGNLDLTDSDTCFCWCFWSFEVPVTTLKNSTVISVRGMDESLALQPRDMYWNATGMMNNWWFRVCIHQLDGDRLRFEHPTMAGTQPGGWMQRLKDTGLDPAKPKFSISPQDLKLSEQIPKRPLDIPMTKDGVSRKITVEEFEAHNTKENPWFVVRGEVYDGTAFLDEHPGGPQSITLVAGEDATEDFMAIHSTDARKQLANFHIGTLVGKIENIDAEQELDDMVQGPFLSAKKWKRVILLDIEAVSKDSKIYRFKLQRPDQELGLPVGQHVYVRLRRKFNHKDQSEIAEGELVQRAYTPVSRQNDRGFIDMLIKIYYPSAEFPRGGQMTLGFSELVVGDIVELKGPIGHFTWLGRGKASIHGEERVVRQIGMVCGGSGITPILQVLRGILHDSSNADTAVWVLDVNRYHDDILCRAELDQLAEEHRSRFRIHYTLTGKPVPGDWEFSTGRINDDMLRAYLPPPSEDGLVCVCGPPLMEQAVKDALSKFGWDPKSQLIIF